MSIMIKSLMIASAVMYLVSTVLYFVKKDKLAIIFHILGWLSNMSVVLTNWVLNGYVPFVSMTQVMSFIAAVFSVVYLYVKYVHKMDWSVRFFSLCSCVFCTGVSFMDQSVIWHFPPALQSGYFVPHVMCYMLSYSLCAVAFCLTIYSVFLQIVVKKQDKTKNIENLNIQVADLEKSIYTLIVTAMPFMLTGMCLGAMWADDCWGNYWSWDPKETWALITFVLYGAYIHTKKFKKLKILTYVLLVLAFLALIMTFVGVSALNIGGEHAYT